MHADEQPDASMMATAARVADFIGSGGIGSTERIFASENVTIIENFAPYVFSGVDAVEIWSQRMRAHLSGLAELRHQFGRACDFSRTGDEVYFSLPTTWSGLNRGKAFTEHGGWAFVLKKYESEWRVRSYGWAVTESSSN
jgi:hypothetical protein